MLQSSRQTDPASFIPTRLSLPQLLLLLSYVILESSLPSRIGDIRQLEDIIHRDEDGWHPQIGQERYPEMEKDWHKACQETQQAWRYVREYMLQRNLIKSTVSSRDLRENLCQLLYRIEQISAQGFNAIYSKRASKGKHCTPLSEEGSLVLVCLSVSVTSSGGAVPLNSLLIDPRQHILKEMNSQLRNSPLFREGISLSRLKDALNSLDMIFEDYNTMSDYHLVGGPFHGQTSRAVIKEQGTWIWHCEKSNIRERGSRIPHHNAGEKRPRESMIGSGDTFVALRSVKRWKHKS